MKSLLQRLGSYGLTETSLDCTGSTPAVNILAGSTKVVRRRKWQHPNPGEYKTNFDGPMFNECDEAGVGIVIRDSGGMVVAAMAEKIKKPHSV